MVQSDTHAREAVRIRERLTRLDAERMELEQRLAELAPAQELSTRGGEVTSRSPTGDKIALFRSNYRHSRRARVGRRFRLFFRYDARAKVIVYAWVNDRRTLRSTGSGTNPYSVFARMLARGNPPPTGPHC